MGNSPINLECGATINIYVNGVTEMDSRAGDSVGPLLFGGNDQSDLCVVVLMIWEIAMPDAVAVPRGTGWHNFS